MRKGLIEFILVASPKVLGGLGTIAVSLVLMRFLGPGMFAQYALCMTGILLADAIIGSAFDLGVLRLAPLYRLEQPQHSYSIEKAALLLKFGGVAGAGAFMALIAPWLGGFLFHEPGREVLIYVSVAAAMGLLLLRSAQVHLQVDRHFMGYSGLDLAHQTLRYGGIALALWLFPKTALSPLLAVALAPIIVFAASFRYLLPVLRSSTATSASARELLASVKWFLLTFAITASFSRMDVLALTSLSDLTQVGLFSGAAVFLLVPQMLGSYIQVVLSPRIMPAVQDGTFGAFFRRFQTISLLGAAALFAMAAACMPFILKYVLPAKFSLSAPIMMILLPGALAMMISFPLTIPYLMFVRPAFIVKTVALLAPVVLLGYWFAIPKHGAIGAAWVSMFSLMAQAIAMQVAAWRQCRLHDLEATQRSVIDVQEPAILSRTA